MKTQTDSRKYEGQCKFCKKDFTKRQIVNHLDTCSSCGHLSLFGDLSITRVGVKTLSYFDEATVLLW